MIKLGKKVEEMMAKVVKHYGECAEKGNAFSAHGFYKPETPKKRSIIQQW
ncbi:MAG: hypothetical protein ACI4D0_10670 [Lachnospira sp.]